MQPKTTLSLHTLHRRTSSLFQNAHLLPPLPQRANAHRDTRLALDILHIQQLVLLPESEKVREEGVEVRFGAEVEDLGVVCVVEMGEDAEELAVDVFYCGGEVCWEITACVMFVFVRLERREGGRVEGGGCVTYQIWWGRRSRRLAGFAPMS